MSSDFLDSDSVGRVIDGKFPLLRWLGGTQRSSVFLTELEGDSTRKAAIKLIPAGAVDAQALITQWAAAQPLSHPHLVHLFHFGHCEVDGEDLLYVVTEYAEEVLSEVLPERPLTPAETREMLDPLLEALSYLHDRNFVHGHLKPSNIMAINDQLKLSIDGLYAAGEFGRRSTAPGMPEVGAERMTPAADMWSVGVVLVEALTQQPPVWDRTKGEDPIIPSSVPQPFFGLARECLRIDPVRRCTLSGVKAHLQPAQAAEGTSHHVEPTVSTTGGAPVKRGMMILIGAVLVLLLGIAAVKIGSHHSASSPSGTLQHSASAPAITEPQSPAPLGSVPKGLVVKGAVVHQTLPDVPPKAINTIQGHVGVVIRVQVDRDGNVSNATIDSQGSSRYFADQALQTAVSWKFRPAQVDGRAVPSTWILQFQFERTRTAVTPVETAP